MTLMDPTRIPRRFARAAALDIEAYTGPVGELVINTSTMRLHLQDGSTPGGVSMLGAEDVPAPEASLTYLNRADVAATNIPAAGEAIRVLSYAEPTTGGSGVYTRMSAAPTSVKPWQLQSDDGAWWELSERIVNMRMFGARGDGVTNDTPAIQAAIDYVEVRGGGEVWCPAGIYGIGAPALYRSCVTLVGEGALPSGCLGPTFRGTCFRAIANLTAMFTQANIASPLHSIGMRGCTVDAGQADGKVVQSAFLLSFINSRFTQNMFRQGTGTGFTNKANPIAAWINWFSENYVEFFSVGVLWEGTDSYIHHNYISSCLSNNIIIDGPGGNQVTGNMIDGAGRNNTATLANPNAVALLMRNTSGLGQQSRNVLTGNHFGENAAGDIVIAAYTAGGTLNAGHMITGNMFHNVQGNSILIGENNRGGVIVGNDFSDIKAGAGAVVFSGNTALSPGWSLGPNTFSNASFGLKYVSAPAGTQILGYS